MGVHHSYPAAKVARIQGLQNSLEIVLATAQEINPADNYLVSANGITGEIGKELGELMDFLCPNGETEPGAQDSKSGDA